MFIMAGSLGANTLRGDVTLDNSLIQGGQFEYLIDCYLVGTLTFNHLVTCVLAH